MNSSVLSYLFYNQFIIFLKKGCPSYYYFNSNSSKKIYNLDSIIEPLDSFMDEIRCR